MVSPSQPSFAAAHRLAVAALALLAVAAPLLLGVPAAAAEPVSDAAAAQPIDEAAPSEAALWWRQRTSLRAEVRSSAGIGRRAGMRLQLYGVGAEVRLTPALAWRLAGFGLRLSGTTAEGDPARFGFGGESALQLSPWQDALVRPYLFGGVGLVAFPTAPFIPGGDYYDFMLRGGGGIEVAASERITLGLNAFATHISNGQGLGPQNPALDGYGAGVSFGYALERRRSLPPVWQEEGSGGAAQAQREVLPAVMLEGAAGLLGREVIVAGRARVAQPLGAGWVALLDGEGGSLAAAPYGEVGLGLAAHFEVASLGAHGGYRRFVGLDTWLMAAQLEGHVSEEVSLLALGHYEDSEFSGGLWRAALGARGYPHRTLLLEVAVGLEGIGKDDVLAAIGKDDALVSDLIAVVGVEWALPLPFDDWQVAVFGESQLSGARLAGLRVGYGVGASPRAFAQRRGWRRMR